MSSTASSGERAPVENRRYRITHILGKGGFGIVYRARLEGSEGFQKDVAVKLLSDEDPPAEVLTRFRDEARILGLLRDPHIITVDPPTRLGGRWAVVMEFVDGANTADLLKKGTLPPAIALWIPDGLLVVAALWVLSRTARDRPFLSARRNPQHARPGGTA